MANSLEKLFRIALVALSTSTAPSALAASLQWDANGPVGGSGGSGTWNTSSLTWFNGATYQAWNNAVFDDAVFGGTAGTVTLGGAITVHNLSFTTSGYTVTGSTLTLAGAAPTVDVSPGTATIGSVLAGAAGLTKAGIGTLTLTGTNTYRGGTTIEAGTLQIGNGGTTGSSSATSSTMGHLSSTAAMR